MVLVFKEDDSTAEREDGKLLKAAANDAEKAASSPWCFATPVEPLAAAGRAKRERKDTVRRLLSFMSAIE